MGKMLIDKEQLSAINKFININLKPQKSQYLKPFIMLF